MHGISFNVSVDLDGFQTIVPCGLQGERVSSLKKILGAACPTIPQVRESMARNFSAVCMRSLEPLAVPGALPEPLAKILKG
jgi:lipoate-protein ligase B